MFFWIHDHGVQSVIVQGSSMSPTLVDGQKMLVHRWVYLLRKARAGDIVVLRDPFDRTLSVKRVIALPNQTVQIRNDRVYVDDTLVEEPYLQPGEVTTAYSLGPHAYQVTPRHYFVMGDNRDESEDSRFFGGVVIEDLIGVIFKR